MRVVHVVRQYRPAIGGLEEAVAKLAAELARMDGFTTRVVTLDRLFRDRGVLLPRQETIDGIGVTRIGFAGSTRYPIAPAILGAIADADLVHVHAVDFFFDYLALTRRLHRKPLVASTHGGFFHTGFARGLKQVYFNSVTRLSASAYAAICASSHSDAALFTRIAPRRTLTIENGVDVIKWAGRASGVLRPTMLCLGRFSANKRIGLLFPVLRRLLDAEPAWRLIVAGGESDLRREDLEALARHAGVAGAVEIVTGASDEAIGELIGKSSYLVSASTYEGFGLSVVEGLSAGLQPLISPIPPFERLVAETGLGDLLPFADAQDAATAILRRHEALGRTYALAREAGIAASRAYSWATAAERFAAVYERAVKSS